MKTQQKISKNGARHVDLWHDVSQTFSCRHEIYSNLLKSSDLIKPPEEFFQKHLQLQQIPPSLRLAVEKVQVIQPITSAKPWSAPARSARRNRWHWGRGCGRCRRRRTFHRPRRSTRPCARRGLRAPFRSGTADSSDWPGESVAKIWSWLAFYKYLQVNTKLATCPQFTQIFVFPASSPPLRHYDGLRCI